MQSRKEEPGGLFLRGETQEMSIELDDFIITVFVNIKILGLSLGKEFTYACRPSPTNAPWKLSCHRTRRTRYRS